MSDNFRSLSLKLLCDILRMILKEETFLELLKINKIEYKDDKIYLFLPGDGYYFCLDVLREQACIMLQIETGDISKFPSANNYELGKFTDKMRVIYQYATQVEALRWMSSRVQQNPIEQAMLADKGFIQNGCLVWYRSKHNDFVSISPRGLSFPKLIEPTDDPQSAKTLSLVEMDQLSREITEHFLGAYSDAPDLMHGLTNPPSPKNYPNNFSLS